MPLTPSTYSGCVQWIDPAAGVTLSSGKVSAVTDQSSGGNNLAQATAGNRPIGNVTTPASFQLDVNAAESLTSAGPSVGARSFSAFMVLDFQTIQSDTFQAALIMGGVYTFLIDNVGKFLVYNLGAGVVSTTLRPTSSKCVLGITSAAGGIKVYCNGASVSKSAAPSGTLAGMAIGDGSFPYYGNFYKLAIYDNALADVDAAAAVASLMAEYSIPSTPDVIVVEEGDSITFGIGSTANNDYKRDAALPATWWQYCVAQGGLAIAAAAADASSQVDTLYQSGIPFIYSGFIGTNTLFGGTSAADTYTAYVSLLQGRKTANAAAICAAYTVLPRAGIETDYNILIRADFPTAHPTVAHCFLPGPGITYADILIDVNAIPGVTFVDGVHPDDAGYALIGAVVGPALKALVPSARARRRAGSSRSGTRTPIYG